MTTTTTDRGKGQPPHALGHTRFVGRKKRPHRSCGHPASPQLYLCIYPKHFTSLEHEGKIHQLRFEQGRLIAPCARRSRVLCANVRPVCKPNERGVSKNKRQQNKWHHCVCERERESPSLIRCLYCVHFVEQLFHIELPLHSVALPPTAAYTPANTLMGRVDLWSLNSQGWQWRWNVHALGPLIEVRREWSPASAQLRRDPRSAAMV